MLYFYGSLIDDLSIQKFYQLMKLTHFECMKRFLRPENLSMLKKNLFFYDF
jgi:hypothetical protein